MDICPMIIIDLLAGNIQESDKQSNDVAEDKAHGIVSRQLFYHGLCKIRDLVFYVKYYNSLISKE